MDFVSATLLGFFDHVYLGRTHITRHLTRALLVNTFQKKFMSSVFSTRLPFLFFRTLSQVSFLYHNAQPVK